MWHFCGKLVNPLPLCFSHSNRIFLSNGKHPWFMQNVSVCVCIPSYYNKALSRHYLKLLNNFQLQGCLLVKCSISSDSRSVSSQFSHKRGKLTNRRLARINLVSEANTMIVNRNRTNLKASNRKWATDLNYEEPQAVIFLPGIWLRITEFGIEGQIPRISLPVRLQKRC